MAEDALSYTELVAHLASQLGVAFYGAAGDEVAQAPEDVYTLAMVKNYVNGGFRMLLGDAPPEGWRFQQPVASVVLWPTSAGLADGAPVFGDPSSTVTVHTNMFRDSMVGHDLAFHVISTADGAPTYDSTTDVSTVNVDDAIFNAGMVGQKIAFTATQNTYTIIGYTDTTTVLVEGDASGEADADIVAAVHNYVIESVTSVLIAVVTGDASGESDGATVDITADGNYTLPSTFGGEYLGPITYAAGTNVGGPIAWTSEGRIREYRQNVDSQTGNPTEAAIRKSSTARQWELMVHMIPGAERTVEFPYELYFTAMSATGDLHPAGAHYDETVLAACEGYAEMKGEDKLAGRMQYYKESALPAAHRRNARSAPKRLGNLLDRTPRERGSNWRNYVTRPDVTI